MAQELGYGAAFLLLGLFAAGSVALWLAFAPMLKPACAGSPRQTTAARPHPIKIGAR
jgi:hypothetical protein